MFGQQLGEGSWLGSAVAFAVPVAGALNWTLVQHSHSTGRDVDLVPAVLIGGFLSAVATLPLAWPLQANVHDVVLLAGLGVGQLAVPCVLSVVSARALSAPEVSLLALLEVLFGIAMAWWGAHEVPQFYVLQGGALVLGALLANEWLGYRQRKQVSGCGP
jgi:drug/metabolite transporter (DMT)-like permease